MPKISVKISAGTYQVRFEYPDLEAKVFRFATYQAARQAIELAHYVQSNDIPLTDIDDYERRFCSFGACRNLACEESGFDICKRHWEDGIND